MNILANVLVFIVGSSVGSFLNVCIYRLPQNLSIIKPGSYCTKCKTPIKWHDNIPILSFIFLGAKCRHCKERIRFRYLLVELITAVIFLVLYIKFGPSLDFVKYTFFFCILMLVSFIDIDYHAIPVYLCFIGIVVGLLFDLGASIKYLKTGVFELQYLPISKSFIGLVFGFGFTYIFKFFGDILLSLYLSWRKKESIEGETESLGLGDVDFMGMVGVFLGIKAVVVVFFLAPFIAAAYSIFALIFKRSHLIPYLPYLSLASLIVFFWGEKILSFIL